MRATPTYLFERYRDAVALEGHRRSEHYKTYRASLPELC